MEIKTEFESVISRLKALYPTQSELYIEDTVENAVHLFKNLSNDPDIVYFSEDNKNWIKRACVEMIERKSAIGTVAYSENGFSMSFDRSQISKALANEIVPKVGYPK